jgi:hypothetical protein
MIKNYKWLKIGSCLGAFICFLLLCVTIYFSPNFVAHHFSADGSLQEGTIFVINLSRLGIGILSAVGLLIGAFYIIKPDMFRKFDSISNHVRKKSLKLTILFFPVVFVVCVVLLKKITPWWYYKLLVHEDSIGEWLTFIFYFFAFMVSFSISITYFKRKHTLYGLMYMFLTLGLFFIAGEEISWGQRIFNEHTPAFFMKYNYQKEMNIHNLKGFPLHLLYIIVGFYGAFSRLIIPKKVKTKYRSIVNLFFPDYYLFFYFFVVGILYFYYNYLSTIAVSLFGDWVGWGPGHFIIGGDQEPAELLLSCGFLLFVMINKYRQIRSKDFTPVITNMKY